MSDEELIAIYHRFDSYLNLSGWGWDFLRGIGFSILKGLANFVDYLGTLLIDSLSLLGFYQYSDVGGMGTTATGILNDAPEGAILYTLAPFQYFGIAVALLSIVALLFFGKNEALREVPLNIIYVVIIVGLLPSIMENGIKIVTNTADTLAVEQGTLGFSTVKNNLSDLYGFVDTNWETTDIADPAIESFVGLDINEIIDDNDADPTGVLNHKPIFLADASAQSVVELEKKSNVLIVADVINMFLVRYYRWHINWVPALITLMALAVAIVLSILRVGRLGIEATFNYIVANIIGFFSFHDTKRLKQTVISILAGFVTILSIFVLYYLFISYMNFVNISLTSTWGKLLGTVGGAWLLYDGPAIIQQLFGVDAGLGTAGGIMMAYGIGTGGRMMKSIIGATANTAGYVGGLTKGFTDQSKKNKGSNSGEDDQDSPKKEEREKNQHADLEDEKIGQQPQEQGKENQPIDERLSEEQPEEDQRVEKNQSKIASFDTEVQAESANETSLQQEEPTERNIGEKHEETIAPDELSDIQQHPPTDENQSSKSTEEKNAISPLQSIDNNHEPAEPVQSSLEKQATQSMKRNGPQPVQEESEEGQSVSEKPISKPDHPLKSHLDTKLCTPKNYEQKGSLVRNTYDRTKKGNQFGKELADYFHDKKQYKNSEQYEIDQSKKKENKKVSRYDQAKFTGKRLEERMKKDE